MKVFNADNYTVQFKSEDNPLTIADLQANSIILSLLKDTGIPVLSEESKLADYNIRKHWPELIIVDPLDGTKEFINKSGDFTVNIALVRDSSPVLGVVYAPYTDVVYWGMEEEGSWKMEKASINFNSKWPFQKAIKLPVHVPISSRKKNIKVVASKSHLSQETVEFINSLKTSTRSVEFISRGSSLKLCILAEGIADIYPRLGPTMEWDICAGHAVVKFAGKFVKSLPNNEELRYNKKDLYNGNFIAS